MNKFRREVNQELVKGPKHIEFRELPNLLKRKTKTWEVNSIHGGAFLGLVRWYSPWRKFGFFPVAKTVFEEDCLRDIAQFIKNQTFLYKKK